MNSNTPSKEQIEARKKVLIGEWEKAIASDNSKFGGGYDRREFTFSKPEHVQLTQQQTIIALAENATQQLLNVQVLPRVGVIPSAEVKITYDLTIGRFAVWVPKKSSGVKS